MIKPNSQKRGGYFGLCKTDIFSAKIRQMDKELEISKLLDFEISLFTKEPNGKNQLV